MVNLEPVVGHEQDGKRPAVVVSVDRFNKSRAGLLIVVPTTTVQKGVPWHIRVTPADSDIRETSYIKCEDLRSISTDRLIRRCGTVSAQTMSQVESTIKVLLKL